MWDCSGRYGRYIIQGSGVFRYFDCAASNYGKTPGMHSQSEKLHPIGIDQSRLPGTCFQT